MSLQEYAAVAVACAACVFDLRSRRIPNALTFGAALAAFAVAALLGGPSALVAAIAGWAIGTALWLPMYALGGMGAGDVKLVAAVGAWLGPEGALWATLYASVAGGVMAAVVVVAQGAVGQTCRNIQLLIFHWRVAGPIPHPELTLATARSARLAYALPVLAGTVGASWLR